MAYAHSRGIIHRDLKPANVMVGDFGEVLILDWGMAKVLDRASRGREAPGGPVQENTICTLRAELTEVSPGDALLGTLGYMAPEQARSEIDRLDRRTDVFGLGAVLCEILTGQPPYCGASRKERHQQAQKGDQTGAHARLDACGADVEMIALAKRCLAPQPADRPRDAGEVAQAVAAHQAGVEERARKAELERAAVEVRAGEERKRRRLAVALAAAVLLLLGGGMLFTAQLQVERDNAVQMGRKAQEERGGPLPGHSAARGEAGGEIPERPGDQEAAGRDLPDLRSGAEGYRPSSGGGNRLPQGCRGCRETAERPAQPSISLATGFRPAGTGLFAGQRLEPDLGGRGCPPP